MAANFFSRSAILDIVKKTVLCVSIEKEIINLTNKRKRKEEIEKKNGRKKKDEKFFLF